MKTIDVNIEKKKKENKIALSLTTFDKYEPGTQKFYIQALTPTRPKSTEFETPSNSTANLLNKNPGSLGIQMPQVGSCVELEVPKDVTRWFEVKFIPPGTRFIVAFDGGDVTRPRIIGRDYVEEQGAYNSTSQDKSMWNGIRI